jgi:uncharacterized protein YjbJ (UPF0337 family)
MSTDLKIKGNWNELKGKLKTKYGELTDDDLAFAEGQEEQLLGKVQEKTGETEENLKKMMFSE